MPPDWRMVLTWDASERRFMEPMQRTGGDPCSARFITLLWDDPSSSGAGGSSPAACRPPSDILPPAITSSGADGLWAAATIIPNEPMLQLSWIQGSRRY